MKSAFVTAAFVASVATGLSASAASADETTIIHEQRTVQSDQTKQSGDQQIIQPPTTAQPTAAVAPAHTRRHYVVHRVLVRHVTHRRSAHVAWRASNQSSASAAAVDTNATVQQNTEQRESETGSPTVIDRRTVIHRDDEGNVERHTRVIRQGPDSTTVVDHRSSDPATPDVPPQ